MRSKDIIAFYNQNISYKDIVNFELCTEFQSIKIVNKKGKLISAHCLVKTREEACEEIKNNSSLFYDLLNGWLNAKIPFIKKYLFFIDKESDERLLEIGKMGCIYGIYLFMEFGDFRQFDFHEYIKMWIKIMINDAVY